MEQFKRMLKKVFCLSPRLTVFIAVPSFVFVCVILALGDHSALSYAAYLLSAYALIITGTGIFGIIEAAKDGIERSPILRKIRNNPLGKRLLGDAVFRSEVALQGGLIINLLYAGLNLFYGVRFHSAWFVTLAVYYVLLSAMRGLLVRYVSRTPVGANIQAEYRRYRGCGVLLLLMNQALAGIVVYMVYQNRGFSYPGHLIYAMAAYTFYITISSVINVIKYRKRGSPILSASKVINLTAALVSMMALETAMIAQFGQDEPKFRRIMTSASGGAVCVVVLGMAIYMIARAGRELRKFNDMETKV